MEEKLSTFFQNIDPGINSYYIKPGSGHSILKKDPEYSGIDPQDFLDFAELDFKLEEKRGYINALSNVKRAIESQSDVITLFTWDIL